MSPRYHRCGNCLAAMPARARRQQAGAQAFARLLNLAEERDSGQIRRIARFLAATYNGQAFPFDLFELRAVDIAIGDDMLCCLDALRWARADLYTLVPERRCAPACRHRALGSALAGRGLSAESIDPRLSMCDLPTAATVAAPRRGARQSSRSADRAPSWSCPP